MLALAHLLALTDTGSHRLAGASHVPFCDGGWLCIKKLRRDGVSNPKSVTVTSAPHHKKLQLQFEGAAQGTETCFDRSQCLQSSSGSGGIDSSLPAFARLVTAPRPIVPADAPTSAIPAPVPIPIVLPGARCCCLHGFLSPWSLRQAVRNGRRSTQAAALLLPAWMSPRARFKTAPFSSPRLPALVVPLSTRT